MSEPASIPIPPGVRIELYTPEIRRFLPAGCKTAVRQGDVIYVSDVQYLNLTMGDSIAVLDLNQFVAGFNRPLPMTTRPQQEPRHAR